MEAIIISGLPASGKSTVAKILAQKLKVKAVNVGDIIKSRFHEAGKTTSNFWDTSKGFVALKEREKNEEIDKSIDKAVLKIISKGNIVIASYVMPWLSKHGYKVWLDASPEERAKRLAKRDKVSIQTAREIIKKRDKENFMLYKKLYNIRIGKDKKPFDLVIETEKLSPSEIVEIIIKGIRHKKQK
ncbi:MAG: cytidylate kinase family protein [Candidatus Micrarchaeia archaeon]|jgi:cytidylate kinase